MTHRHRLFPQDESSSLRSKVLRYATSTWLPMVERAQAMLGEHGLDSALTTAEFYAIRAKELQELQTGRNDPAMLDEDGETENER